ncbi:MAG: glucosidase [Deltaproteobacteria bacterium]|nr:glucosidase [Deltaproteobacteria bacterium]
MKNTGMNAERERLEAEERGAEDWRLWGPYLSERAWGTVREDYSPHGTAWEDFSHDQARSRAYRWNEDGMGGISDKEQRLCFALALWNGVDPILKERAFGLTGNQGNHGEDVKEYYFYLDATPSHSYMSYLYKYPQAQYPYSLLVDENGRRTRSDPPFSLLDSGVFSENRYWDVEVQYAKATPEEIHIRVIASNRGPGEAMIHLLPTLWFRNTWSWGPDEAPKPVLEAEEPPDGALWAVKATHPTLGDYYLYGRQSAEPLYTENESNGELLWGWPNATPYVKDSFHRRVINNEQGAINQDHEGTKFAAWHTYAVGPGQQVKIEMVLSAEKLDSPFSEIESVFRLRESEADEFYSDLAPAASQEEMRIIRQAAAGMIWNKQFYHFDVARWQDGDRFAPPESRKTGRNSHWRHLKAADIISMPDKWEYPWFAAWDLAFHSAVFAMLDPGFAKGQIELLLRENYFHPRGQVPAYEWAFDDVNPPVLAAGALKVFQAEREVRGKGDLDFLHRVFNKLLMNFTWWVNRKDSDGRNIFEGGFMGLDNISVYDRSRPLPPGYTLKQADSTGWMAMFALNMTVMALELAVEDRDYEEIAIQCYSQFLSIANAISGHYADHCVSLWDNDDGFFKDLIMLPDGRCRRLDVFSWVGIIPIFACEVVGPRLLSNVPRFAKLLKSHAGGLFDGHHICACPATVNEKDEHLLSLVDHTMLPRILKRLLSEEEFLSRYGIRSVSRVHAGRKELGHIPGIGSAIIEYEPGEATGGLFGGNSNWRGPIWMPTNFLLIESLERFHRYLGDNYRVEVPCMGNREMTLKEVATLLSERLINIFRRSENGLRPAFEETSPFQHDAYWKDLLLFNEYFHAETGRGLGASHQTGWTGLVGSILCRRYSGQTAGPAKEEESSGITSFLKRIF